MMRNSGIRLRATGCALVVGVSVCGVGGALADPSTQSVAAAATPQTIAEKVQALKATSVPGPALSPESLGSYTADLVYTPITPCRVADTRVAGGSLTAYTTRTFDVDGSNFSSQGGSSSGCGIPYGVSYAVAMTITSVGPAGAGYFTAWGLGTKPNSSALNFTAGQNVANTTIVPVVPGVGNDFSVASTVNSNIVMDVLGYYAPPVATALDCVTTYSAITSIPYDSYTAVDAFCTAPYTVTGGGTNPIDGSAGRWGVWTDGSPTASNGNGWRTWADNQNTSARSVQTYARCCRIPGR